MAVAFKVADASILMFPTVSIEDCGADETVDVGQVTVLGNALAGEMHTPFANSPLALELA